MQATSMNVGIAMLQIYELDEIGHVMWVLAM